jgi:hypothetical protein
MEFQKPVAGTVLDHHCALRGGIRRATRRIGIQFPNPEPAAGAGTFGGLKGENGASCRQRDACSQESTEVRSGARFIFKNWISSPVLLVVYKPVELAFACAFRPFGTSG